MEKGELFRQYKNKYHMLFSKSGFTKELEETTGKMGSVELVDMKRMFEGYEEIYPAYNRIKKEVLDSLSLTSF